MKTGLNKFLIILTTSLLYVNQVNGKDGIFVLDGYCPNQAIKEFKLIKQNTRIDYEAPILLGSMKKDSTNYFHCSIEVNQAQYVDIIANNKSWKIFIYPNGNQTFSFDTNGQLHFEGKDSKYSNCVNELQYYLEANNIKQLYYTNKYAINDFVAKVDSIINIKKLYIYNYEKKYSTELPYLKKALKYQYINLLYEPFVFGDHTINELPAIYRKQLSLADYNDDLMVNDLYYTNAARDKFILMNTTLETVQQNFTKIYNNITSNTSGKTKEYLISALVALYVNNNTNVDHTGFLKIVKNNLNTINDKKLLEKIKNNYNKFRFINKVLPDTILDETVLISYKTGEKISLRNVLNHQSNQGIYLDFWASWCAPCRMDIEEGYKSKLFLKDNSFVVIYLSIDNNNTQWKRASEDEHIQDNQFLLEKGNKSAIGNFLEVTSIPRYVLLDKNHKLMDTNAPRLNDMAYQKLVQAIKVLSVNKVTYD